MTEWKIYRLGDIASFSQGIQVDIDKQLPYKKDGYVRFIRIVDFTKTNEPYRYIETPKKQYLTNSGDIVMIRYGSQTAGLVVKSFEGAIANNMFKITLDEQVVDRDFIYYALSQEDVFSSLRNAQSSSTMPAITFEIASRIQLKIPSLEEQRRIAGILGAIDDKIENNRRINTNLELQAQALYKQWFVDNRSDDWETKPLSEIAEFIGGYSYKGNELVESSSTAMATIKNFERKGGFKVEGFKDIVASPKLKAEQHAKLFDILVAHTDLTQNADVIGNAEILLTCGKYSDIIFSMDLVKVLPKACFSYKYLLAAMLKNFHFKAHCLGYVNGTTVLHMSKKALPEYIVSCPSNSEAEKMDRAFKAYYHKMAEILQENETLATLRDTLLPKLMNGEIKV